MVGSILTNNQTINEKREVVELILTNNEKISEENKMADWMVLTNNEKINDLLGYMTPVIRIRMLN